MIKYFKINEQLTEELEEKLIEFLNELEEGQECKIFFSSAGGNSGTADNLIEIFNSDDRIKQVIFGWQCSSGGFRILCGTSPLKREVQESVWSIVHRQSRGVETIDLLNKDSHTQFLINETETANKKYRGVLEYWGFKEEQLRLYDEGKDVYLTYDDIMKLNIWN